MNLMNITAEEARYYRDAQMVIVEKFISAVKKYFAENARIIAAGLTASNGTFFNPFAGK